MTLKRTLAITLLAGATATAGYFAIETRAGAAGGASIGTWGFDIAGMDTSVKPGDDFFRHVGGTWMKNTPIPADRSRWGSFNMLAAKSEEDVRNLVEAVARASNRAGSIEQKVADYFEALALLTAMPTPRWRRPNSEGNRGIVAGIDFHRVPRERIDHMLHALQVARR